MALWQTGIQWAPTRSMLKTNPEGALEHVAKNFVKWTQRVIKAVARHKDDPQTKEASRRTGQKKGQHGLTDDEFQKREAKRIARANYYWARDLESWYFTQSDRGSKRKRPSRDELWWLNELWGGNLEQEMQRTAKECHKVQAKEFIVFDSDD